MKKNLTTLLLTVLVILTASIQNSCSRNFPQDSSLLLNILLMNTLFGPTVTSFTFTADSNSVLNTDVSGTISGTTISVELPWNTSWSDLTPTFALSSSAKSVPNSDTSLDISSGSQTIQLIDGNGNTVNYTVTLTNASLNCSSSGIRSPGCFSDLSLWLKADSLDSSSTLVSSWTDSSSISGPALQATSSLQPDYQANQINGLPALYFDGADIIEVTSVSLGAFTMFVVFKSSTAAILCEHSTDANSNPGSWFYTSTSTTTRVRRGTSNSDKDSPINMGDNTWRMATQSYNGTHATNEVYSNGNLVALTDGNINDPGLSTATNSMYIGRRSAAGGSCCPLTGYIAEMIYYNRALDGTERESVECYLQSRYAISVPHTCN